MRGGFGILITVVGSLFYLFAGFWRLLQFRKYFEFTLVFIIYFGLALVLYFGFIYSFALESPNMRIWVITPFILLLLIWFLSGFFVQKYVLDLTGKNRISTKPNASVRLRVIGAILTCSGLGVWLYGSFSPFSENIFIWALISSLVCMTFGIPYLMMGRKISDLD